MIEKVPTFVVNLEADRERLADISKALENERSLDVRIVSAVHGSGLPRLARFLLCDDHAWADHKGEIGCFLSHVKIWEIVAQSSSPFALILEDDAVPIALSRFGSIEIPSGADLLFINKHMSTETEVDDNSIIPNCVEVVSSLHKFLKDGVLVQRNVGTYGYILSPHGARKLLDAVSKNLIYGHLDWRLLRYSVLEDEIEKWFGGTELAAVIKHHHNPNRPPFWNIIKAYCLDRPLVEHREYESVRLRENDEQLK